MRSNRKKTGINILFLTVVIIIAYFVLKDSWGSIWEELRKTSGKVLAGVAFFSILYNCFEGMAVTKLLKSCDKTFPWYQGILCSFYSAFFRVITFGSGSGVAGMYYVSRWGIPAERSLGIFTINYTMQRITICLYFVGSFLVHFSSMSNLYQDYAGYMILGVVLAVIVAAALIVVCICEPLHRFGFQLAKKYIRRESWLIKLKDLEENAEIVRTEATRLLKNKKLLLEVTFWNFCKLTSWYLIPAVVFRKLHSSELSLLVAVIAMVTALAGVIPAPGGVGAVEFVFVLMFTPVVGEVLAASGMLIYRGATYILPFAIGAAVEIKILLMKKGACHLWTTLSEYSDFGDKK